MKDKYVDFINGISKILGLERPVDILKLYTTTDLFFQPLEKRIIELEAQNKELQCCSNCNNSYGGEEEPYHDCEYCHAMMKHCLLKLVISGRKRGQGFRQFQKTMLKVLLNWRQLICLVMAGQLM